MVLGLDVATLDQGQLTDALVLAALNQHHAQLEHRLEAAANPRHPKVCQEIAAAAFELFLTGCTPELGARLEARRAEILAAMIAQRQAVDDAVQRVGRRLDRLPFLGPVNAVMSPARRINAVVAAPGYSPVFEYVRLTRDQLMADVPLLDSAALTWADLEGRNSVLYGTSGSPLVGELLAHSSWQVTATHVSIGQRKIEGERLALIACRARPEDPTLGDVVYTSFEEQDVIGINALHHGPSDFVIGRPTRSGRYQIVTRGSFARGPEGQLLTILAT
jgi:hypothetical protein